MKAIIIFLFCIIIALVVIGVAAGPATPGTKLYSYKLSVNEPVSVLMRPTKESKGVMEVLLVERRFQELNDILAKEDTSPVVMTSLNADFLKRQQAVTTRARSVLGTKKILVGYVIYTQYAGVAAAYSDFLSQKYPTKVIALGLDTIHEQIAKQIAELREDISHQYSKQQFIKGIEERFTEVDDKILAVTGTLNSNKNLLSTEQYDEVSNLVDEAKQKVQDAENKRGQEFYSESFVLIADAHSTARRAGILLQLYGAY